MTIAPAIHADLITPLGAYLRLRAGARAGFVTFEEAEREVAAGRPVVGYLGYDHVAVLEPTVPLPEGGAGLPESRFVVADTLVRFDHAASVAEVLAGDPAAVAARLRAEAGGEPGGPFAGGPTRRARRHPRE